jgi:hypothetical protein
MPNTKKTFPSELGIGVNPHVGIGDAIQFTCIPENYYRNTGKKIIDVGKCYVFDHNPYVRRGVNAEQVIDLWGHQWELGSSFLSKSERWCEGLGLEKCYLRHPRLYIYEDTPKFAEEPVISFHCTGKTRGSLSDKVISVIEKNYEGFKIIQIGGPHDKPTPFIDKRGLSFWESAKIVAESQLFIGVTSGMYYASRCYPNVRKKIIVQDNHMSEEELKSFTPYGKGYGDWIDFDVEIFNTHDHDIGITNALQKL